MHELDVDADAPNHNNTDDNVVSPPENYAYQLVAHELDKLKLVDFNINLDDPDQAANLCDDTAFTQGMPKLQSITTSSSLIAGIRIHPGMDDDRQNHNVSSDRPNICPSREECIAMRSKAKENQRNGAAVLVRLLTIFAMLVSSGRQALLLIPWPSRSTTTLLNSRFLDEELKKKVRAIKYEVPPWTTDASYEVITTSSTFNSDISLEDATKEFIDTSSSSLQSSTASPSCPTGVGGACFALPSGDGA